MSRYGWPVTVASDRGHLSGALGACDFSPERHRSFKSATVFTTSALVSIAGQIFNFPPDALFDSYAPLEAQGPLRGATWEIEGAPELRAAGWVRPGTRGSQHF